VQILTDLVDVDVDVDVDVALMATRLWARVNKAPVSKEVTRSRNLFVDRTEYCVKAHNEIISLISNTFS